MNEIGFPDSSRVLTAPGSYAWGDSALLCTPLDMLHFGRLLANGGRWNGKQLLSAKAVHDATNTHIYNKSFGNEFRKQGYGYQIWGTNGLAFFGMHGQFTIYNPATDILFVCTAGYLMEDIGYAEIILRNFFREIINTAGEPIPADVSFNGLKKHITDLTLLTAKGNNTSALAEKSTVKPLRPTKTQWALPNLPLPFLKTRVNSPIQTPRVKSQLNLQ